MKRNTKKYRSVLAAIMAATVIFTTAAASPTYASEQTESEEVSAEVIVDTASESEEAVETIETESQEQEADGDEVSSEETNAEVETTETEASETVEETEVTETVTETEEQQEGTEVTGEAEATGTETAEEEKETGNVNTVEEADVQEYLWPEITGLDFKENGQTVAPDTMLHFSIKTENFSGMKSIYIYYTINNNQENYSIYLPDAEEVSAGVWDIEIKAEDYFKKGPGEYQIVSISAGSDIENGSTMVSYKMETPYTFDYDMSALKQYTGTFSIIPDKDVYELNDKIRFESNFYDIIPADNRNVTGLCAIITKDGITKKATLNSDSDGFYLLTNTIDEGTWKVEAIEAELVEGYSSHIIGYVYLKPAADSFFTYKTPEKEEGTIPDLHIDRQGENLQPGDTVNVEFSLDGVKNLPDTGTLELSAIASGDDYISHLALTVTRKSNSNIYQGSFDITDNMYPTEWYISSISLSDKYGRDLLGYSYKYMGRDIYFNCLKDGEYVEKTADYRIIFITYDEHENWLMYDDKRDVSGKSRTTLGELVGELPKLEDFNGEKFVGWMDAGGNFVDENTEIYATNYATYNFFPVYEKQTILFQKTYLNNEGQYVVEYEKVKCAYDEDETEVLKRLSVPEDLQGTFSGWTKKGLTSGLSVPADKFWVTRPRGYVVSVPEGKRLVCENVSWLDKNLVEQEEKIGFYVDSASTTKEIYDLCKQKLDELQLNVADITPEELGAEEWTTSYNMNSSSDIISRTVEVYFTPDYQKGAVVYDYLSESGVQKRDMVIYESGEQISLPSELSGYDTVTWQSAYYRCDGTVQYSDVEMPMTKYRIYITFLRANPEGRTKQDNDTPSDDNNGSAGDTDTPSDDNNTSTGDNNNTPSDDSNTSTGDTTTPSGDNSTSTGDTTTPSDNNSASAGENNSYTSTGTAGTDNSSNGNQTAANDSQKTSDVTVLPAEKVSDTVNKINAASTGAAVSVTMGTAKTVPVEVLNALKGKDANVVLNMGGYSWTINGKNITADTLKAINLGVRLDQNAIAQNVIATVADGQPTRQLSLDYSGEFGFTASLNLNLGAENAGQFGNLYYYNSTGQLVFMNAGKIDANGNVSLSFTHASDYVIVIDKDRTAQEAAQSPKTGENFPVLPVSVMVMSALGLAFLYAKKRENF